MLISKGEHAWYATTLFGEKTTFIRNSFPTVTDSLLHWLFRSLLYLTEWRKQYEDCGNIHTSLNQTYEARSNLRSSSMFLVCLMEYSSRNLQI